MGLSDALKVAGLVVLTVAGLLLSIPAGLAVLGVGLVALGIVAEGDDE